MEFLYFLEGLRTQFLDSLMLIITHLGEEYPFMIIALFIFWCVDKYEGYYILFTGFIGTQINQLLKVVFRIDRPWIKDPNFKPVEGSIKQATGYSFPSGHTQNAVGTFGGIARWNKNAWLRATSILIFIAVAFSRMYLGVHTPYDVGVSLIIAAVLVFGLYPIIQKSKENHKIMHILLAVTVIWSVAQILFMEFFPFPSSTNTEELFSALKNSYKMLGAVVAFIFVYEFDRRYIDFKTEAAWWAQIIKVAVGLVLVVAVKEISYTVFGLFASETVYRALSYFMMVIFAGCIWPLTFKWFAKTKKVKKA